jgi:NADPH-dependent 2,4-dienoyl-CoA reductase/sulfur reductase-like enzyme/nitrite reductase/ring-hydroxylating ferredoxin subunit
MAGAATPEGPDFTLGVPLADIPSEGALGGRAGDEPVLLLRRDDGLFAVSGACTHYGGPLAKGLIGKDSVRCPWHHACFDLRTGEALRAPAFDALARWKVEVEGDRAFVRERLSPAPMHKQPPPHPQRIVIVGGGAAGFSAAEMLRRRGYQGSLVMLSDDAAPPVDRPNLSKDYLAGTAPEDWIPLKPPGFYADNRIDLRTGVEVSALALDKREVVTASGERFGYDRLLLATGSEPIRIAGFDHPNVHTLRTLADSRAIIAAAQSARSAVVVGSSFIGLEVAASLRHRGLPVHVVGPEEVPMQKALGRDLGLLVQRTHEAHGVVFHLGVSAGGYDGTAVGLSDGSRLAADLVILGVGVRPRTRLAESAGLKVDKGVVVDDRLRTSSEGVFAAGDIARYPDPITREPIRVEHWVHACRQGQTAAVNMLGGDKAYDEAPFFWSNHYDLPIRYVGHVTRVDSISVDGSVMDRHAVVGFLQDGRRLAAASIGRARATLEIETELEGMAR